MTNIEVANTQFPVCFESVFVFPEHCAFCLCEVFTHCHRYSISYIEQCQLYRCWLLDHAFSTVFIVLNTSIFATHIFKKYVLYTIYIIF